MLPLATAALPYDVFAPALPITHGLLLDFTRDPLACMRQLYRAHGPLAVLEEEGQRLAFAIGPAYNQLLLSDPETFHARFFTLRGPRYSSQRRLTNTLLSMNGDEHKRHRRLVIPPLQKRAVEGYRDAIARLATALVQDWQPGQVRDVCQEMTRYMLRVTSTILFGFDHAELAYELGRRLARWVGLNHDLGIGAFVTDVSITSGYPQLLRLAEELEAQVLAMLEHRRSLGTQGSDLLALLLRAYDDPAGKLTYDELIGHAAILFGAAYLTTTNTFCWTLFLLAQHPRVAADLVDELRGELMGEAPTLPQLERLPLLDRVLKESMRVLPASFYSQRLNAVPVELGRLLLARGTGIVFSQFMTHHLPELFPDPDRFRPERWETIQPSPYAYLPFAAGPHMCIGATMAMLTLKVTLPVIVQRVRLSVVPGARIDGKVMSTMLTPLAMPMLLSAPTPPFTSSCVEGNVHDMVALD